MSKRERRCGEHTEKSRVIIEHIDHLSHLSYNTKSPGYVKEVTKSSCEHKILRERLAHRSLLSHLHRNVVSESVSSKYLQWPIFFHILGYINYATAN